jgi:hypothetical protein
MMIGRHVIHENLPAHSVDLNHEAVYGMSFDDEMEEKTTAELMEATIDSGTVECSEGRIGWGRTKRDEHGFADVLIDRAKVTEPIIRALDKAGIIT